MDFEIEGDDDYDFQEDWSKSKSKKGKTLFGSGPSAVETDPYDFDFGEIKKPSKGGYSPTEPSGKGFKGASTGIVSKSTNMIEKTDDALAKAQDMINKYSSKQPKKLSSAKTTMYNFDEDDISLDSNDGNSKAFSSKGKQKNSKV